MDQIMKNYFTGFLFFCICCLPTNSQTLYIGDNGACDYYGLSNPSSVTLSNSFASNSEAEEIIKYMLALQGLSPKMIISEGNVQNAAAITENGKRYIVYNPSFMMKVINNTGSNWSAVSILAHEVGHHLNGHTLDGQGSRPDKEI